MWCSVLPHIANPTTHLKKSTMLAQTVRFGISSNSCSSLQDSNSAMKSEEPKIVVSDNKNPQSIFLDRSQHIVTILHLNHEAQFSGSTLLKSMAVDALEEAKCSRNNGVVVEMLNTKESSEIPVEAAEDFDAATSCHVKTDIEDDGEICDEQMNEEGVRKKLQVLAEMVGVDCLNPGVVLARVVKILKSLEREIEQSLYAEN